MFTSEIIFHRHNFLIHATFNYNKLPSANHDPLLVKLVKKRGPAVIAARKLFANHVKNW